MKRFIKSCIAALPYRLKAPLVRRLFNFENQIRPETEVKVAETVDELTAAFEIVRSEYSKVGYLDEQRPMELPPYLLKHSATIVVAKVSGRVVGTLSLIKGDPIGLPLERAFPVFARDGKGVVAWDRRHLVAEISRLAVCQSFRRSAGVDVLFPLLKFMYRYATEYFSVETLLITCLPRDADFYRAILMFEHCGADESPIVAMDYLGAPAVLLKLDLLSAPEKFRSVYSHSRRRNLYRYFTIDESPQLRFPERFDFHSYDSAWTGEILKSFLSQKDRYCLPVLGANERRHLGSLLEGSGGITERRFEIGLPAQLYLGDSKHSSARHFNVQVVNVGLDGVCIYQEMDFPCPDIFELRVQISHRQVSKLKVRAAWRADRRVGLKIVERDQNWNQYWNYLARSRAS